ncbi:hypothetical protein P7D73_18050 [Enterococcus raffinosus]|uniref:hypothetical protein n=1 Tax=Enterococcus raffinosus TaxID=71452 RepID=UPI00288D787D|nr:hypothetical protein [Enterococcus raffinosus]MDT2525109.1 hypothetical protein [Enterococcus raffinosus]MDT2592464.1 hypothetical protein [Enterococcus raffinosus]
MEKNEFNNPIDVFFNNHGKTRYMVGLDSGLSDGQLYEATKKSVKKHNFDFYEQIGISLEMSGSEVITQLLEIEAELYKQGKLSENYKETMKSKKRERKAVKRTKQG